MGKIPKPRKGGQTGGSGHAGSKFTSVRRGGRPGAARGKSASPCLPVLLAGFAVLAVVGGAVAAVVQA